MLPTSQALCGTLHTYGSLLDLIFPELGQLLEIDGVGIRALLQKAPTPQAIARLRLATLEKDWKLRPKAAQLKALAAESKLAAASAPALVALLQSMAELEARLRALDRQIEQLALQAADPARLQLLQTLPGFGPISAAKLIAYLPEELLQAGSNRTAATRLQAFMGNDPRQNESGQFQGKVKMTKRGVEPLRTAFFQAAFSASQHDPELKAYYQRKRLQGKAPQSRPQPSHAHLDPSARRRSPLPTALSPTGTGLTQKCRLIPLTPVIACLHRLVGSFGDVLTTELPRASACRRKTRTMQTRPPYAAKSECMTRERPRRWRAG